MLKNKELKLFAWTGFCPNYTCGLAFAVARNLKEAKLLVQTKYGDTKVRDWGDLSIHELNEPCA